MLTILVMDFISLDPKGAKRNKRWRAKRRHQLLLFLPMCSVPTCFSRLILRASTSLWSSILCWTLASTLGTASNWKIKAEYVDKKQTSAQLFSRQADHTSAVSQLCHWLQFVEWKDNNNLVRNYPTLEQIELRHMNHQIKHRLQIY